MFDSSYDYLVIGSGAGGATLVKELAAKGSKVLVVEKGKVEESLGTENDALGFLDLVSSDGGVIVVRGIMAGGGTTVSCGNGVRALQKEFNDLGIDLEIEFAEAEKEMGIAPIDPKLLSKLGSAPMLNAAKDAGEGMVLMPKFIRADKCTKCGNCMFGCKFGAKWTALDYLASAKKDGAEFLYNVEVTEIIIENGQATGAIVQTAEGKKNILAKTIILAAGGLVTPVILQKSGLKDAGKNLFVDLLINTYAFTDEKNMSNEPNMALLKDYHQDFGFIVSPFGNPSKVLMDMEFGSTGKEMPKPKFLGLMTKIADEATGHVNADGSISKKITVKDQEKLDAGIAVSKRIFKTMGIPDEDIYVSKVPLSAHPGGTAAIGTIVDTNLKTEIDNLYVCDASVFPQTPGLPPILTITALAKRLAKHLTAA